MVVMVVVVVVVVAVAVVVCAREDVRASKRHTINQRQELR